MRQIRGRPGFLLRLAKERKEIAGVQNDSAEEPSLCRRGAKRLGAAIAAVCALLLLLGAWAVWNGAQAAMREQAAQSLRTAVLDAAVQCYALEGAYPQSLSYLEENYGVQVNHSRFIVSYEAYASNQLPAVAVLEKQTA